MGNARDQVIGVGGPMGCAAAISVGVDAAGAMSSPGAHHAQRLRARKFFDSGDYAMARSAALSSASADALGCQALEASTEALAKKHAEGRTGTAKAKEAVAMVRAAGAMKTASFLKFVATERKAG